MGLLKVGMRLQGKLKGTLGFVELAGSAIDLAELVGRVGVAGIELQFFLELFRCLVAIFYRGSVPRTREQRPTQSIMNTRTSGGAREHPLIFIDRLDIRCLTFPGFCGSLVAPDGVRRYL